MREYDKAVLYYNEILSNDKFQTPTDIIISLTEIYSSDDPSIRNFGKAEELAKLAIQKDPENFLVHDALGRVYENENEYDEALKSYKKALSLYDKDEFLYLSIGRIYSKQSDFPAAEQSFNKALEINRNSSNAFEWLAHIYSKARKWDQAVKFQKSAKEAAERQNLPSDNYDKGLALIYHDKGLDLYNQGNFQDAIEEYNKANNLSESDITYRNISLCYFYLGEYPKALTAIEKAIRLIPPDDPKYNELKMQYEKELQDIKTKLQ
jgi:tetratricopeptide (TPR) repeat protein